MKYKETASVAYVNELLKKGYQLMMIEERDGKYIFHMIKTE